MPLLLYVRGKKKKQQLRLEEKEILRAMNHVHFKTIS